jgi:glycerol kinase
VSGVPVERPLVYDAASLGAAYLAGIETGFWKDLAEASRTWRRDRIFEPQWSATERAERTACWKRIVELARHQP